MSSLSASRAEEPLSYAAATFTSSHLLRQPKRKTSPHPTTGLSDVNSEARPDKSSSTPVLNPSSYSTTSTTSPGTAMISGHTDLPQDLFDKHYIPQLASALKSGANFILGDAKGVDEMALTWLLANSEPDTRGQITVHCSRPYNVPKLETLGVNVILDRVSHESGVAGGSRGRGKGRDPGNPNASRQRHLDRDARMTAASDFDILYVRTDEEAREFYGERWRKRVSATEMNRDRRTVQMGRAESGQLPLLETPS